jgi:hypothetical protein
MEKVVTRKRLNVTFMRPLLVLFRNQFRPCITKCIQIDLRLCAVSHFTVHLFQAKNLRPLSAVDPICNIYKFDSNKLALAVCKMSSAARKIT